MASKYLNEVLNMNSCPAVDLRGVFTGEKVDAHGIHRSAM
jgi:hypothetical protein